MRDRVDFLGLIDPRQGSLDLDIPTLALTMPARTRAMVWLHVRVPLALRGFDGIFHSPFNFIPFWNPVPSVVTVHDISFVTHPHLFPRLKARAFRSNAAWALKHAAHATTVSEWARTQILDRYRSDPDRVHVVANGVDRQFRPMEERDVPAWDALRRRLRLPDTYLVAFGGVPRRGLEITLEVWRRLRALGMPHGLVVLDQAGPPDTEVVWVPIPAQEDLPLLLAGAELMLYPTETESFGLPAVEAAACGTPSVCSRVGALPEVLADGAIWCEREADSFVDAAARVLEDQSERDEVVERGRRAAARWSWDRSADELMGVYKLATGSG